VGGRQGGRAAGRQGGRAAGGGRDGARERGSEGAREVERERALHGTHKVHEGISTTDKRQKVARVLLPSLPPSLSPSLCHSLTHNHARARALSLSQEVHSRRLERRPKPSTQR